MCSVLEPEWRAAIGCSPAVGTQILMNACRPALCLLLGSLRISRIAMQLMCCNVVECALSIARVRVAQNMSLYWMPMHEKYKMLSHVIMCDCSSLYIAVPRSLPPTIIPNEEVLIDVCCLSNYFFIVSFMWSRERRCFRWIALKYMRYSSSRKFVCATLVGVRYCHWLHEL